jgi:hypothetical protein
MFLVQSLKVVQQTMVSGDRINHFLTANNSKRNSVNNSIAESGQSKDELKETVSRGFTNPFTTLKSAVS